MPFLRYGAPADEQCHDIREYIFLRKKDAVPTRLSYVTHLRGKIDDGN